jgi:hypothetical protein
MGLNANRERLETEFDISGFTSEGWEKMEHGKNYLAFLATRKKM